MRAGPAGRAPATLYIGGVGLARGYWRDPARTAARFVSHPRAPSGTASTRPAIWPDSATTVWCTSWVAATSQIKSRGYRIELGEIEAALNTVAGVDECAVVALQRGGFEGAAICCAYAAARGNALTPAAIRRELSRLIPSYMLPSHWLSLDRLPMNANGKVDRSAPQGHLRREDRHRCNSCCSTRLNASGWWRAG